MAHYIKYLTFTFLIVLAISGCQLKRTENYGAMQINGRIKFACNQKIFLLGYPDSVSMFTGKKVVLDTFLINKDGDFYFNIKPSVSNIYELRLADTVLMSDLYLIPNNTLTLHFLKKYDVSRIDTSNITGKCNDYRAKLEYQFYREPQIKQLYYISANYMTVPMFDSFCKDRRTRMLNFYANYFNDKYPDRDFDNYARAELKYQYAIDKLMYLWKKRIKNMDVFPDSIYYDFSVKSYLEDKDALQSQAYFHFLKLYINNIYGEDIVKKSRSLQETQTKNPVIEKYKLAIKNLSIPFRDIVLCNIISGEMTREEFTSISKSGMVAMKKWFENKYPETDGLAEKN